MRTRVFLRCFFPICFALVVSEAGVSAPVDLGEDIHGNPIHRLTSPVERVAVLFFAASDCPISNRYAPEIERLSKEFGPHAVHFWWVYPNPGDTAAVVAQHNRDYSITTDTILDAKQSLVQLAHARVTPEAAVFQIDGGQLHEVYHGRIDDRYLNLGQERPQAEHHDLEMAIAAALAGKPVPQPGGPPVGCSIVFLPK